MQDTHRYLQKYSEMLERHCTSVVSYGCLQLTMEDYIQIINFFSWTIRSQKYTIFLLRILESSFLGEAGRVFYLHIINKHSLYSGCFSESHMGSTRFFN